MDVEKILDKLVQFGSPTLILIVVLFGVWKIGEKVGPVILDIRDSIRGMDAALTAFVSSSKRIEDDTSHLREEMRDLHEKVDRLECARWPGDGGARNCDEDRKRRGPNVRGGNEHDG